MSDGRRKITQEFLNVVASVTNAHLDANGFAEKYPNLAGHYSKHVQLKSESGFYRNVFNAYEGSRKPMSMLGNALLNEDYRKEHPLLTAVSPLLALPVLVVSTPVLSVIRFPLFKYFDSIPCPTSKQEHEGSEPS